MVNVPVMNKVCTALCQIAGNRAGGSSRIFPEMVKVCSDELLEYLVKLYIQIWNSIGVFLRARKKDTPSAKEGKFCRFVTIGYVLP